MQWPKLPERVHFIGIGGAGMSALATILLALGYRVSGSDLLSTPVTRRLEALGGRCYVGHDRKNVQDARLVVISSAISPENPELVAAKKMGIPIIHRADLLAWVLNGKKGIAVAGAHGKTTTTSMLALVLEKNGFDPTIIIGGELNDIGGNAKLGWGEYVVAESDESDGSFLKFRPDVAVVTNVEPDHLENYQGSFDQLVAAYQRFLEGTRPGGAWIIGVDSPVARELAAAVPARDRGVRLVTYGLEGQADWSARSVHLEARTSRFVAWHHGRAVAEVHLSIPGRHNVANALAAMAVGLTQGVPLPTIVEALGAMPRIPGRFEALHEGQPFGVVVDYAHTPDGLENVLRAARAITAGRLVVVFGCGGNRDRTKRPLMGRIAAEWGDVVVVTSDNPRGEDPLAIIEEIRPGVAQGAAGRAVEVRIEPDRRRAIHLALELARAGDLVLIAGKGHETYQEIRGVKHPFDDRQVARERLRAGTPAGRSATP